MHSWDKGNNAEVGPNKFFYISWFVNFFNRELCLSSLARDSSSDFCRHFVYLLWELCKVCMRKTSFNMLDSLDKFGTSFRKVFISRKKYCLRVDLE